MHHHPACFRHRFADRSARDSGLRSLLALCLVWPLSLAHSQEQRPVAIPDEAATAPLEQPMPIDPDLRLGELDNGLDYYIRAHGEPANRAELRLVVRAGSILEDDDQRGLAHVLEHMAFNGTENFEKQQIVDFMNSIGMRMGSDLNAATGFDQTIYMLRVPTDNPIPMVEALRIVEDWIAGMSLEPDEIEQERNVVIEEWRGGQNAGSRIQAAQMPVVLAGSRYAERLPIGTLESLQTFEHDALRRFYADWYRPDLMALVAVGDFDPDLVEQLVRERLSHLTVPDDARERPRYEVPDFAGTRVSIATDPELPSTRIDLAYRLAQNDDWTIGGARRRTVESLYANLLTQRLAELTRQAEPPFVVGIGAKTEAFLNTGPAFVLSALVPGNGVQRALETLIAESERAMRFGFTAAELERVLTQMRRQLENQYENRSSQSSASYAGLYTSHFLRGTPVAGIEYDTRLAQRFLDEIGLDEINRVAADWAGDSNRVVLLTAPEREDLVLPTEAELLAVIDSRSELAIEAYAESDTPRELLADPPQGTAVVAESTTPGGIIEWRLANGLRVLLKPTDFDEDLILFRAFSPGGLSLAADQDLVPARTALRIVGPAGLGELDANALNQVMAGKLATVSPYINEFSEGLTGRASLRDLETLFQLIYLRFTAPRADASSFGMFRAQAELMLGNRDRNPQAAFSDRLNALMTRDHPRRRPETLEMLESADPEASLAFYRDRFADAGDFTFVFVGSFEPDALRPFVEQYLGALPATGREESWRDVGVRPPEGTIQETIYRGVEPVAQTQIVTTGPLAIEDVNERTLLTATARVMQERLRGLLREELGATYSINVGAGASWLPLRQYSGSIQFSADPARVDELVALVLAEIATLRSAGPTESEVADVREALKRQHEINLESNSYWLGLIASSYEYGFDADLQWQDDYPASIDRLTPAVVQQGLQRYFSLENHVRLTMLPEDMEPKN